ncbi:MAG: hypothetical protein ILP19_02755 [Oscillospiraceae bacterium]|nr:hypothetical protein [Oscillospiraceae bacterium]
MLIKIGQFDITECWDGVFYKKLSDYPNITEWEIQTVLDFIGYEEHNGRTCTIEAEDSILSEIEKYKRQNKRRISPPDIIRECTACPTYKGCMTDLVCHTSPVENAVKILDSGRLLSPVLARDMPASELRAESRNAANDPEDYFDYIMFAWGNCQAGDRLVMERKLGRFPSEDDLSNFFTPGVRFFFRYNDLICHPEATFEGVLPLKIKNEVVLKDWCLAIIAPTIYKEILEPHIPDELRAMIHFLDNDCKDIWEWSEKVYEYAKGL